MENGGSCVINITCFSSRKEEHGVIDGQPECEQDHLAVHQQVNELDLRQKLQEAMAFCKLLKMKNEICMDMKKKIS